MRASVPHLKKRSDFLRVAGGRRKCAAPGLVLQVAAQEVAQEDSVQVLQLSKLLFHSYLPIKQPFTRNFGMLDFYSPPNVSPHCATQQELPPIRQQRWTSRG